MTATVQTKRVPCYTYIKYEYNAVLNLKFSASVSENKPVYSKYKVWGVYNIF
jgi:hypothetical protein